MSESDPPIYKPTPRRQFILGDNFDASPTDTPTNELLSTGSDTNLLANGAATPSELSKRSQSIKNLTTSALFGIYGPSAYDSTPGTPGANTRRSSYVNLMNGGGSGGVSTPSSPVSPNDFSGSDGSLLPSQRSRPLGNLTVHSKKRKNRNQPGLLRQLGGILLLFLTGAGYGLIIARLHDESKIVPVKVEVERDTPSYFLFWGVTAVVLGSLLPWVDGIWADYVWESGSADGSSNTTNGTAAASNGSAEKAKKKGDWDSTPVWNPAIRSIGAFVGIAYGIRKLPWQSTSQASLTLAFVNPVLWYLLDRTRTGFWLSSFVAIFGSIFLIGFNPDFVAIPNDNGVGIFDKLRMAAMVGSGNASIHDHLQMQVIGGMTWIASVLYVSSLCFGNIGRKLYGSATGEI